MNESEYNTDDSYSFKDYLILLRNNLAPVVIIIAAAFIVAIIYAFMAVDIYKSEATLKLAKSGGSILQSPFLPEIQDYGSDRFISNEIEILKSYNLKERVALALIDTIVNHPDDKRFELLYEEESAFGMAEGLRKIKSVEAISSMLNSITIEQKRGLDIIVIGAESPSPFEASLIANTFANEYRVFNLQINRDQLTFVKNFLEQQKESKRKDLMEAEDLLRTFQEKGGVVALDAQASELIRQLSQFEAQKNAAQIELRASEEILKKLKQDLIEQDPKLADYLESVTSEVYLNALQKQISELQIRKDLALSGLDSRLDVDEKVKEYSEKISDLRKKLDEKIKVLKAGIYASSPVEVKELSRKIVDEELKSKSLRITKDGLENIVNRYEQRFNTLPKTSIDLARFQRNRESTEKLYILLEEKYQEAFINEQSQPGNVLIIDKAREPKSPSKPNRLLIIIIGTVLGFGLSFAYVFTKNYFDNTVKTPEDIQKKNVNVLAWIPEIEGLIGNGDSAGFVISKFPDSIPSEAFRALRTRVHFSTPDITDLKTILITSPAPREGKTTIAVNLAGSFAQTNKKVLLLDCDLRKPRIHNLFNVSKTPGLIDYLFGQTKLEDITRKSEIDNLSYITSGTIPPNPAEMLASQQLEDFLTEMKKIYDIIIIDSPPVVAVTDSEILSRKVDGAILVVSSEVTEADMLKRAVELLKHDNATLLGTVLNNFSYKAGYASYYKYYYYYAPKKEVEG